MKLCFFSATVPNYSKIMHEFAEYCNESNFETNLLAIRYVAGIARKIPEALEESFLLLGRAVCRFDFSFGQGTLSNWSCSVHA